MPRRAIVYSDGFGHPFEETGAILTQMVREAGWRADMSASLVAVLGRLDEVELLVVNALRWTMTQHEKYEPHRAQWAYSLGDEQLAGIERFVSRGGRLLVMHTGVICWDNQPGWRSLMGGGWHWGRSYHPPLGEVVVRPTDAARAMGASTIEFCVIDEAYHHLDPGPDCDVLATAASVDGAQPIAWIRPYGGGRVAVNALGHDGSSLRNDGHATLIAAILRYLADD